MLNIKKCNLFLISTVFVLLLVSILVGIKVLFSNMHGLEWGSVTDWFSAISTLAGSLASFGTLYIAYKAFKKAPEWINKKIDEDALSLCTDTHFILIEKISESATRIKSVMANNGGKPFSKPIQVVASHQGRLHKSETQKNWKEFCSVYEFNGFVQLAKAQILLTRNLRRFEFMGWVYNKEKLDVIHKINNSINSILLVRAEINLVLSAIVKDSKQFNISIGDSDIINNLNIVARKLTPLEENINKNIKILCNNLDSYKNFSGDFFSYFENISST